MIMEKTNYGADNQIVACSKTPHHTVDIYCPIVEQKIPIDVGISELIQLLWDNSIMTFNSCEDNFGCVWIEIANSYEMGQFFTTILIPIIEKEDWEFNNCMYSRIHGDGDGDDKRWSYKIHIDTDSYGPDGDVIYSLPPILSYSIRFPKEDYSFVLELFKQGRDKVGHYIDTN